MTMVTMADLIDQRTRLMDYWEKALKVAEATGYWGDAYACGRLVDAFHDAICEKLNSGAFSGDTAGALAAWEQCGIADKEYRRLAEANAREHAPQPDATAWWAIFGVAPSAPDEAIRTAYTDRLKQCHPDRVSGLAPQIIQLAEEMTKKLNRAFDAAKRRPAWWTA